MSAGFGKGMDDFIKETVYSDSDAVGICLSGRRRVLEKLPLPPQHHHLQWRSLPLIAPKTTSNKSFMFFFFLLLKMRKIKEFSNNS